MAQPKKPGTFCWVELGASNATTAKSFYGSLFGWTFKEVEMPPNGIYTMAVKGGKDVLSVYDLSSRQPAPRKSTSFIPYIAVDNADDTARLALNLGATILANPFDIMDIGRTATIEDPCGAAFCVWESKREYGAPVNPDTPGAACWYELVTRDPDITGGFYSKLFGWTHNVRDFGFMNYIEFLSEGTPVAGLVEIPPDWDKSPSHWLIYFTVEDCEKTAARTVELGGAIRVPPKDLPKVGRFCILEDPQLGSFAVFRIG